MRRLQAQCLKPTPINTYTIHRGRAGPVLHACLGDVKHILSQPATLRLLADNISSIHHSEALEDPVALVQNLLGETVIVFELDHHLRCFTTTMLTEEGQPAIHINAKFVRHLECSQDTYLRLVLITAVVREVNTLLLLLLSNRAPRASHGQAGDFRQISLDRNFETSFLGGRMALLFRTYDVATSYVQVEGFALEKDVQGVPKRQRHAPRGDVTTDPKARNVNVTVTPVLHVLGKLLLPICLSIKLELTAPQLSSSPSPKGSRATVSTALERATVDGNLQLPLFDWSELSSIENSSFNRHHALKEQDTVQAQSPMASDEEETQLKGTRRLTLREREKAQGNCCTKYTKHPPKF
ncbi:hypothetical protein DXG01_004430 [Tephrocybe rancida]|nr:hypothetical protein DXG01_004430 [Tephrocybe rancida]